MSADNGHYVIKMPNEKYDGVEWRVAYACAIDNLFFKNENGNPIEVIKTLDRAPRIFDTKQRAADYAITCETEWIKEEGFGTEYGVCEVVLPKSYAEYVKELMPAIYAEIKNICDKIPARWDDSTRLRMISELVELAKEYTEED
jgi:hypothetical protein